MWLDRESYPGPLALESDAQRCIKQSNFIISETDILLKAQTDSVPGASSQVKGTEYWTQYPAKVCQELLPFEVEG